MTQVISLRLPSVLERAIRSNAVNSKMRVADCICLILECAVNSDLRLSELPDTPQSLDCKLDVRLPAELVARVRTESSRFQYFGFCLQPSYFVTPITENGWYLWKSKAVTH